jgi:hypothetical protein
MERREIRDPRSRIALRSMRATISSKVRPGIADLRQSNGEANAPVCWLRRFGGHAAIAAGLLPQVIAAAGK